MLLQLFLEIVRIVSCEDNAVLLVVFKCDLIYRIAEMFYTILLTSYRISELDGIYNVSPESDDADINCCEYDIS